MNFFILHLFNVNTITDFSVQKSSRSYCYVSSKTSNSILLFNS